MFVSGLQKEIFETVYCSIVHLSFLTSHSPLFFSLCITSIKATSSVFLSFFSRKTVDFDDFGLILQDLGGLSDGINLFGCYSSPLSCEIFLGRC